ncbi:hypothetical protein I6J39_16790 [Streptomyces californicus]|uniref:Uncharacterized protein n=1 Tax=Streptomyces californicus TaxID=67351 RepID=A0ABX7J3N5_9ACTN|nr:MULTISPECIES: hypothetical protein [Streptomyces]QRV28781.1 hypothetical protein I6J39_16790 [Streptomyces californicus]QRV42195.1 hypothetical protein I6J41_16705 [Streptomyces californicus]
MFGLTTTRRLRAAKLQILGLHTKLGLLQGFRDADIAAARRCAEQDLADEIDAHLATIRRVLADEADLEAERRTATSLAEQLLNATSGQSTAARQTLGLPETGPWERAVDGLNALVDAQIPFHIEPDGHISNPSGDEHIEWDREAGRWRLVHDDETSVTITIDDTLGDALSAKGDGR